MKKAFTLIELMIVIAIIAIVAAIAIPNLLEARKHANEASTVGALKTIVAAEATYLERSEAGTYGELGDLRDAGYLDNVLGSGSKQGYIYGAGRITQGMEVAGFNLNGTLALPPYNSLDYAFLAGGRPAVFGQTGNRTLHTDQSGVIRFKIGTTQEESTNISNLDAAVGGK